jgi:enamine deaminase RidA (YjgF/YER057c/UK114 family)
MQKTQVAERGRKMLATKPAVRMLINPAGSEEFYNTWQFSQAARVGDTVWLAGQLGIGPDGRPGATIEEQTRFAFQNLARVLAAAGGTLADIVDLTTYHIAMSDLPRVAAVKAEFIPAHFPPWTAIGVTQLALPEMLVEVKATAVIGCGT